MREVRTNHEKLNAFKDDFCDKYIDSIPKRTEFIKNIKDLDEASYDSGCSEQFASI